jgi:hypothetical protein
MPVTRERVDPQRDHSDLGLVHRRWLLPDDVHRPIALPALSRLWRGLLDLGVLDAREEVSLVQLSGPQAQMPAPASPGALLAIAANVAFVNQVVWTEEEDRRDPYALQGQPDPEGFRDYTLYAIELPSRLLMPIAPIALRCGSCGKRSVPELPRFGEGVLLDLERPLCACGALPQIDLDKGELRSGAVFLFEELVCRAAFSVELPSAPQSEELPDAAVSQLVRDAFGATDELADDGVPPAE